MGIVGLMLAVLGHHVIILSLMSGFLSEDVLLFIAILSGEGHIPFWLVFLFGFIGAEIHNSLFFVLCKVKRIDNFLHRIESSNKKKPILLFIERIGRNHYFIPLVLSKFIYGTRIAFMFYSCHKEKSFFRYTFYNSIALLIWFAVMMPLGWFAGHGFIQLLRFARGFEKVLGFIMLTAFLLYIFNKLLKKYLLRNKEEISALAKTLP